MIRKNNDGTKPNKVVTDVTITPPSPPHITSLAHFVYSHDTYP